MTISACSSSLLSLLEISRTWNSFGCLCVRGRRRSYLPARTLHIGYIVFFRSRLCSTCVLVCLVMTFLRAKIAGQYDVHDPLKSRAMVSITASCTTTRLIGTFLDVKETRESCLLRMSILREWSSASSQSATFNLSVEIHCIPILLMHVENVTAIFLCLFLSLKIGIWIELRNTEIFRYDILRYISKRLLLIRIELEMV